MVSRFPPWLRQEIPSAVVFEKIRFMAGSGINTVCVSAHCPNIGECFKDNRLTFMILGDTCTRNCSFCAVKKGQKNSIDNDEPLRVAEAVKKMNSNYVVITSVTRDDLSDGGAGIFARTIRRIKEINGEIKVEALIPDFAGKFSSLKIVVDAFPDCLAHNIETVERLYEAVRPQASYRNSLDILSRTKKINPGIITKSSLMLGLGEREEEVVAAMKDLSDRHCDVVTLGQYLSPGKGYYPVKEFVAPEKFQDYRNIGLGLGLKKVLSGPKVRSSYRASSLYSSLTVSTS